MTTIQSKTPRQMGRPKKLTDEQALENCRRRKKEYGKTKINAGTSFKEFERQRQIAGYELRPVFLSHLLEIHGILQLHTQEISGCANDVNFLKELLKWNGPQKRAVSSQRDKVDRGRASKKPSLTPARVKAEPVDDEFDLHLKKREANLDESAEPDVDIRVQADVDSRAEADLDGKAEADVDTRAEADIDRKAEVDRRAEADIDRTAEADVDRSAEAEVDRTAGTEVDRTDEIHPVDYSTTRMEPLNALHTVGIFDVKIERNEEESMDETRETFSDTEMGGEEAGLSSQIRTTISNKILSETPNLERLIHNISMSTETEARPLATFANKRKKVTLVQLLSKRVKTDATSLSGRKSQANFEQSLVPDAFSADEGGSTDVLTESKDETVEETGRRRKTRKQRFAKPTKIVQVYDTSSDEELQELSDKSDENYVHPDTTNTSKSTSAQKKKSPIDWKGQLDVARANPSKAISSTAACSECDFKTTTTQAFLMHVQAKHAAIFHEFKNTICPICCSVVSRPDFKKHFRSCKETYMKSYGGRFPEYLCPCCYEPCGSLSYEEHQYEMHSVVSPGVKMPPYSCSSCDQVFNNRISFKKHWEKDHLRGNDENLCPVCVEFLPRNELLIHKRLRNQNVSCIKTETCKDCGEQLSSYRIGDHINEKHSVEVDRKKYNCFVCHEIFFDKYKLLLHLNETHREIKALACLFCLQNVHHCLCQRICHVCGKACNWRRLRGHLQKHFGDEVCHICGKTIRCHQLKKHMRRHANQERKNCPHCNRKILVSLLKHHVTRVHGVKPFVCSVANCGKRLSTSDSLTVHMRGHTNEMKFQCELCTYTCKQRSALNWHMSSKHKE